MFSIQGYLGADFYCLEILGKSIEDVTHDKVPFHYLLSINLYQRLPRSILPSPDTSYITFLICLKRFFFKVYK